MEDHFRNNCHHIAPAASQASKTIRDTADTRYGLHSALAATLPQYLSAIQEGITRGPPALP